jgi:hypothetical protein
MILIFAALDSAIILNPDRVPLMEPYFTYSDLFNNGDHLEHLHAYYIPSSVPSDDVEVGSTLGMHVDDGLLIAMTTGLYSNADSSTKNGLYMELPTGAIVEVEARDDALIIMVGKGGATWLAPLLGLPFRAVPHALSIRMKPSSDEKNPTRAWYGKMFLPPSDAIIPEFNIPFTKYRSDVQRFLTSKDKKKQFSPETQLPAACGGEMDQFVLASSTSCETDDGEVGVICWTQCYSVADLACGSNAVCYDLGTNEVVDGTTMCPSGHTNCELQCVESSTDHNSSGYCYGRGVTMYMDGFRSVATDSRKTPCLNLIFLDWTLNKPWKFGLACFFTVVFGIFIQYLSSLRVYISSKSSVFKNEFFKRLATVLIFGVQVVSGYFAMLIAMTYNVELFCMMCVGLTLGFAAFHNHVTDINATPCCYNEPSDVEQYNRIATGKNVEITSSA